MNRRNFLAGIFSAAAGPAIIRTAGLLMPIKPHLVVPTCVVSCDGGHGTITFPALATPGDTLTINGRTYLLVSDVGYPEPTKWQWPLDWRPA